MSNNVAGRCTSVFNSFIGLNREGHVPVERKKDIKMVRKANAGTLIKIHIENALPIAAAGPHWPTICLCEVCAGP